VGTISRRPPAARPARPHPRTRERFLALAQIADGTHNATTWAAQFGRQDDTVLAWVYGYNREGPESLTYRRTGSRPPLFAPTQAEQIVEAVRDSEPIDHGLPGHGWTPISTAGKIINSRTDVVVSGR
jgi:transposase